MFVKKVCTEKRKKVRKPTKQYGATCAFDAWSFNNDQNIKGLRIVTSLPNSLISLLLFFQVCLVQTEIESSNKTALFLLYKVSEYINLVILEENPDFSCSSRV